MANPTFNQGLFLGTAGSLQNGGPIGAHSPLNILLLPFYQLRIRRTFTGLCGHGHNLLQRYGNPLLSFCGCRTKLYL